MMMRGRSTAMAALRGAEIDGEHRYKLWRKWGSAKSYVAFVMLNPSTADGMQDDPTIRKCIGFAKKWGYQGIEVVNLFSYRSTDPDALFEALSRSQEPTGGARNDQAIKDVVRNASVVVCAWGGHKAAKVDGRDHAVRQLLAECNVQPMCLGLTKGNRQPRHPLMLAYKTKLEKLE
jgi:hypothetical protein